MTPRQARRKEQVRELHNLRLQPEAIAARLAVSDATVRRDLEDMGLRERSPMKRSRDARRAQVRELHDQGLRPKEIASRLGCSDMVVYQDLRAMGRPQGLVWDEARREAYRVLMAERAAARRKERFVPVCCQCGAPVAGNSTRYRGQLYCGQHLIEANANPDYELEQRDRWLRGVGHEGGRSSLVNTD